MKAVVSVVVRGISDHFRSEDTTIPEKNFKGHKTIEILRNTDGSLASVTMETRLYAPWNHGRDWANTICTTTLTLDNDKEFSVENIECEILDQ
jgi:hypothetical protein